MQWRPVVPLSLIWLASFLEPWCAPPPYYEDSFFFGYADSYRLLSWRLFLYNFSLMTMKWVDLFLILLFSMGSNGSHSSRMYFLIFTLQSCRSWLINIRSGFSIDGNVTISTCIHLPSLGHGVASILGNTSASSLFHLSINFILILSHLIMDALTACKYSHILGSFASKIPSACLATDWESVLTINLLIPKCFAIFKPTKRASYSASLFVTMNAKCPACSIFLLSRMTSITTIPWPFLRIRLLSSWS